MGRGQHIYRKQSTFRSGIPNRTPPRGAKRGPCTRCASQHFNPRSREGSDNPTAVETMSTRYFNPRSREGSDLEFGDVGLHPVISIHAPVKGATRLANIDRAFDVFQSTLL